MGRSFEGRWEGGTDFIINRTFRIAVMAQFLAMDFVLSRIPLIGLFIPYLDVLILLMVWSLCGWKLAVAFFGIGELQSIPNLLGNSQFIQLDYEVQTNQIKPSSTEFPVWVTTLLNPPWWVNFVHSIQHFFLLWWSLMSPIGQDGIQVIGMSFVIAWYAFQAKNFIQWWKFFTYRIFPHILSQYDTASQIKVMKIREEYLFRKAMNKAKKLKIKSQFGRFWFNLEPL